MSLQDDYFDLSESLQGWQKEAFERIWEAFCLMEAEQEDLLQIRSSVRTLLEVSFKEEVKFLEQRLGLTEPTDTNK